MDGLLELIYAIPGQEDERHVGLFDLDGPRAMSVRLGRPEEPHLIVGVDNQCRTSSFGSL
jgi:hypothetical protein